MTEEEVAKIMSDPIIQGIRDSIREVDAMSDEEYEAEFGFSRHDEDEDDGVIVFCSPEEYRQIIIDDFNSGKITEAQMIKKQDNLYEEDGNVFFVGGGEWLN